MSTLETFATECDEVARIAGGACGVKPSLEMKHEVVSGFCELGHRYTTWVKAKSRESALDVLSSGADGAA